MKKLFYLMCMFAGILIFSACEKPGPEPEPTTPTDNVKPVITFTSTSLDTVLRLDLGDSEKALEDVTAMDDEDGDLTSSVKVTGNFDAVGKTQLKYTVSDKAGNVATVTRDAIITANKLANTYTVEAVLQSDTASKESNSNMTVEIEQDTILVLTRLHKLPYTDVIRAKFAGNSSFEIIKKDVNLSGGGYPDISGTLKYEAKSNDYKITSIFYKFTFTKIQAPDQEWDGVCTPQN